MPRNGAGVYSLPASYLAVPATTILASQHNPPLEDIAAEITASLPRSGVAAMLGALTLSADPVSALHAATKQYVDNLSAGLDVKPSCKCATTANITLSGEQTLDGILTSASRVLVKNQSTASQNGIYVSASGAWARATDMDAWTEVPGASVWVEEGTTQADTGWVCTANTGGTIGSTSITWNQFGGSGAFQAANTFLAALAALGPSLVSGDVIYATAANAVARLAKGADGEALMLNSGISAYGMPAKYLSGYTLSNSVGDPTNDIDIAAGVAAPDGAFGAITLASALTKQLDVNWAVGSNQGGLDTGAIANAVYHVFAIKRPDTGVVDALFSLSATAPTMPTNYTLKRRLGSILRIGAAIKPFIQSGDDFLWLAPVVDVDATNPGNSAVTRTLTVPTGVVVDANLQVGIYSTSGGTSIYISPLSTTDTAPQTPGTAALTLPADVAGAVASQWVFVPKRCLTDTSASVRSRMTNSAAAVHLGIVTLGWRDTRGQ